MLTVCSFRIIFRQIILPSDVPINKREYPFINAIDVGSTPEEEDKDISANNRENS